MKKIFIILTSVIAIFLFLVFNNKVLGVEADCESLCASDARLSQNLDLDKCIANCDEVLNHIPDICDELCQSDVNKGLYADMDKCVDPCVMTLIELSSQQDIQEYCSGWCTNNYTGSQLTQCITQCVEHKTALLNKIETISSSPSGSPTSSSGKFFEFPNPLKIETVGQLIQAIIKWLFVISIPLAVIMILYAGFILVTSAGNPASATKAKQIILYTLIGFVIILLANSIPYLINELISGKSQTPSDSSQNTNLPADNNSNLPGESASGMSEDQKIQNCYNYCIDQANSNPEFDADTCLQTCE